MWLLTIIKSFGLRIIDAAESREMFTPECVPVAEIPKEVNPQGVVGNLGNKCVIEVLVGVEGNFVSGE
jgi:hypothetical protein